MNVETMLELNRELMSKIERVEEIKTKARKEKRELSRREAAELATINKKAEAIRERLPYFDPRAAQPANPGSAQHRATAQPDVLAPEHRVADWVRERRGAPDHLDGEDFSIGRILTAMVRRDRTHLTETERRALVEGIDASGGFLTPEVLASQMIDRLRAKGRTFQAGVRTVPMDSDTLMFARLSGGVMPAWKNESDPIPEQTMTFDRVTLKPKTLPLLVRLSQELFDDLSPQAASVIEEELLSALALELDRVILRGSGVTPEPLGIRNQAGVTTQSLGANGAQLNGYQDFATAIGTIRSNNLEPNAAIVNARTAASIDKLTDTLGQPLNPPPSVSDLPFLVSNVLPSNLIQGNSGSVCSEAYIAQWDQVLVGMRTDIRVGIRALDQRYAENLEIGLLCYLRADVAMRHGEAAVVLTGIK
jgi:HK97 family phage major capsid protein